MAVQKGFCGPGWVRLDEAAVIVGQVESDFLTDPIVHPDNMISYPTTSANLLITLRISPWLRFRKLPTEISPLLKVLVRLFPLP